jgi:hypothetical protein
MQEPGKGVEWDIVDLVCQYPQPLKDQRDTQWQEKRYVLLENTKYWIDLAGIDERLMKNLLQVVGH